MPPHTVNKNLCACCKKYNILFATGTLVNNEIVPSMDFSRNSKNERNSVYKTVS